MNWWAAGWNMGGYSPDPDHVIVTNDWHAALAYLVDNVDRWWDQDYDTVVANGETRLSIDGRYLPAHTEMHNASKDAEFSTVVPDARGYDWHFWITPTNEEAPND